MTKIKNSFIGVLLLVFCVVSCVAFAGCAAQALQIGNESDGTVMVTTNETGQAITEVAFKADSATEYGESLAQDGEWANDGVADIHLPEAAVAAPDPASAEGDKDVILNNLQSMRITTSDGMVYEIHQLNLADIKDASICLEGDIAYLEYTSINTGEVVNTLDAEKAYREQKDAEEAAAAQAKAEAAKAEATKNDNASSNQSAKSKSSSAGNSTANPSSNASTPAAKPSTNTSSSSSDEAEDVCVDDVILNE